MNQTKIPTVIQIAPLILLASCQTTKIPDPILNCEKFKIQSTSDAPTVLSDRTALSKDFVSKTLRIELEHFERMANISTELKHKVLAAHTNFPDKYLKATSELESLLPEAKTNEAYQSIQGMRAVYLGQVMQEFQIEISKLKFKSENNPFNLKAIADNLRTQYPDKIYADQIQQVIANESTQPIDKPAAISPNNTATMTKSFEDAKRLLDDNNPEESLRILDSLEEKSERTSRLRSRAVDAHIKWSRARVRDLYTSSQSQSDKTTKKRTLQECLTMLESLLEKYPNHDGKPSVERNIKSIKRDLKDL